MQDQHETNAIPLVCQCSTGVVQVRTNAVSCRTNTMVGYLQIQTRPPRGPNLGTAFRATPMAANGKTIVGHLACARQAPPPGAQHRLLPRLPQRRARAGAGLGLGLALCLRLGLALGLGLRPRLLRFATRLGGDGTSPEDGAAYCKCSDAPGHEDVDYFCSRPGAEGWWPLSSMRMDGQNAEVSPPNVHEFSNAALDANSMRRTAQLAFQDIHRPASCAASI